MDNTRPVLLGGEHLTKALKDDRFYDILPQFKTIRAKISAMHANMNAKRGCSSCQQRRVNVNVERDFAAIVSSLGPEDGKTFKEYFGIKKMVIHAVNPKTRAAYLKEI